MDIIGAHELLGAMGASVGRAHARLPARATQIGQIEGADLLVVGAVTEFEPGSAGAGVSVSGSKIGSSAGGWGALSDSFWEIGRAHV